MKVVKTVKEVREIVAGWRKEGLSVGLVPTMGFLHEGHQSLIRKSASHNDRTVVSVFVNPIQFGPNEDLEAYPRDLNRDMEKVEEAGGDLIFNPEPSEMYPGHFTSFIDTTETTELLCGAVRPVHFRGVCTVVGKLFNIVGPDRAYFGQKDAQQLATVKRFVRDLNFPLEIVPCPIVREEDGLAKSSRNTYLNATERQAALIKAEQRAGIRQISKTAREMTLKEAEEAYIVHHKAVLSPSTFRAYDIYKDKRFPGYQHKKLTDIDWQAMINEELATKSEKTVKNAWGLVHASLVHVGYRFLLHRQRSFPTA